MPFALHERCSLVEIDNFVLTLLKNEEYTLEKLTAVVKATKTSYEMSDKKYIYPKAIKDVCFLTFYIFFFFVDPLLQFEFKAVGIASRAHAARARGRIYNIYMGKSKHKITVKSNKR